MHRVEQALQAAPKGLQMILMGYLNTRLFDPHYKREEDLEIALGDLGLVKMKDYFLPRQQYHGACS